jgi:MFS family permease
VRFRVSRPAGFVFAAYAFFITMLGATLPTPLYPLLERRYSFGELMVTVVFAVYAIGVIAGLIVFGKLSDQIGRKPLLLLGLAFSALSAGLFLVAGSLVPIFVARVVSGLSAGVFTGTATATLSISHRTTGGVLRHSLQSSSTSAVSAAARSSPACSPTISARRCASPSPSTWCCSSPRPSVYC